MSTLKLSIVGFGSRLVTVLVLTANTILLARLLGPKDYGEYIVFVRLESVLIILADLGLSQSANAFTGGRSDWLANIHRTLLQLIPITSAATFVIGFAILWLDKERLLPNISWRLVVTAFAILPVSLYAHFWYNMMVGMGQIWRLNLVRLLVSLLSLVLTLIFIVGLAGGVWAATIIYASVLSVQFLVMIVSAIRLGAEQKAKEPPVRLRQQMLSFGLRGYLGAILSITWIQIPVFFLNATHSVATVGVFSVGQQIVEKVLLPVQAMQDVVYRKMAVLSNHAAVLTMNRYMRVTGWGMLMVSLVGILLAPWGITLVLGEAYQETGDVCRVLLLGVVFMSVMMLLDTYFINQLRRPGLISILAGVNVTVSLVLAYLLIPVRGAMGAAWTLALVQTIGTMVVVSLYLKLARVSVSELLHVRKDDVALIRAQVGTMLWRK